QRGIVSESLNTEALIQRAQIAGRGLRMAQSPAQVEMLLAELQQITGEADGRFSSLESLRVSADDRDRFNEVKRLATHYVDALGEVGAKQSQILSLFESLDKVESNWIRNINITVNSPSFTNLANERSIEALINEASSEFKDA